MSVLGKIRGFWKPTGVRVATVAGVFTVVGALIGRSWCGGSRPGAAAEQRVRQEQQVSPTSVVDQTVSLAPTQTQTVNVGPSVEQFAQLLHNELAPVVSAIQPRAQTQPAANIERLLSEAVAASARNDFDETLRLVPAEVAERQISLVVEMLQLRGYAFYARCEWKEALGCYDLVLANRPDDWNAKVLSANCELSLRRLPEALARCAEIVSHFAQLVEQEGHTELRYELAVSLNRRGLVLANQGKLEDAVRDHDKAIQLCTQLVEHEPSTQLRNALGLCFDGRGGALYKLRKFDDATRDLDKAVQLRAQLVENEGRAEFRDFFAGSLTSRGGALWVQGKLNDAIRDQDKAVQLYTQLVEQEGRSALRSDFAGSLNNRGLVLGAQGRLDDAIRDYNKAVELGTQLVEKEGRTEFRDDLELVRRNLAAARKAKGEHP